jgi:uncharacterized protein (TIGR00288 family)
MSHEPAQSIALLIDCDNARPDSIRGILDELARHGSIHVRRAYGNWKQGGGWEDKLHPFAILPVQQFAYTKGKNATDLAMAIDAMELLFTEKIDGFALVTSDSDFTPLAMKIRAKGKDVYGFGEEKTPEPFRKACTLFFLTDEFAEPTPERPDSRKPQRRTRNELKGDTELMNTLRSAVQISEGEDGWAFLGRIGQVIANQSSLSPSNYGFAKWSDLIRETGYFEEDSSQPNLPRFRMRRLAKKVGEGDAGTLPVA